MLMTNIVITFAQFLSYSIRIVVDHANPPRGKNPNLGTSLSIDMYRIPSIRTIAEMNPIATNPTTDELSFRIAENSDIGTPITHFLGVAELIVWLQ